jgi:hypothetical protein
MLRHYSVDEQEAVILILVQPRCVQESGISTRDKRVEKWNIVQASCRLHLLQSEMCENVM